MNETDKMKLTASLFAVIDKWMDEVCEKDPDLWSSIGYIPSGLPMTATKAAIMILEVNADGSKAAESNQA